MMLGRRLLVAGPANTSQYGCNSMLPPQHGRNFLTSCFNSQTSQHLSSRCLKESRSTHTKSIMTIQNRPVSIRNAAKRCQNEPGLPNLQRRSNFSTSQILRGEKYEAVVIGAGPAGVTCLGHLLERGVKPILWVDPEFDGGRVNKYYREVPSNTKVTMFVQFAEGVKPFRDILSDDSAETGSSQMTRSDSKDVADVKDETPGQADKLEFMRKLDQDKGCDLGLAADMILVLTEGLKKAPGVSATKASVTKAVLDEGTQQWNVTVGSNEVSSDRLVLCTGSTPIESTLPVSKIPNIHLDDALSPTKLTKALPTNEPVTVSVIGASHSAILVLRNLYNLAHTSNPQLRIKWFTRHALRYAEYMDGWILRDNTGLKGEVAVWAKEHLEPEAFKTSPVRQFLTPVNYQKGEEEEVFKKELPGSNYVVQAIGYKRNDIPELSTRSGEKIVPTFDHETGTFTYSASKQPSDAETTKLPGVFGAGIAWPERVVDKYGNVEYAVGFFKFMKFVKRVSPSWN